MCVSGQALFSVVSSGVEKLSMTNSLHMEEMDGVMWKKVWVEECEDQVKQTTVKNTWKKAERRRPEAERKKQRERLSKGTNTERQKERHSDF